MTEFTDYEEKLKHVDVWREDWKQLEEDTMAKREDSIYLFDKHRDVAVIDAARNVPAIGHLL